MTKQEVLLVFARSGGFLKPDDVGARLRHSLDRRSLYSYLLRLSRQGLLASRRGIPRGQLAYRITDRGYERLEYFRQRHG